LHIRLILQFDLPHGVAALDAWEHKESPDNILGYIIRAIEFILSGALCLPYVARVTFPAEAHSNTYLKRPCRVSGDYWSL